MNQDLLAAITKSENSKALTLLEYALGEGRSAWDVHHSLFPAVQRVLNPPFINPHLPKMHAICREFRPYLDTEDIPALLRLEVNEYARRAKLDELSKPASFPSAVSFEDIKETIGKQEQGLTATRMAAFLEREGPESFAKRMLLLGSGYLNTSLGHSVSCTAFILLEMIGRTDQDPWPVLALLADYFCKGGFRKTPQLKGSAVASSEEAYRKELSRAVSGRGVVNLHHAITLYAIERTRHFFTYAEYSHMLAMWVGFMKGKEVEPLGTDGSPGEAPEKFDSFFEVFSKRKTIPVVRSLMGMIGSEEGRKQAGRFLIKGVCQMYQGNYDPHFLTGLGSTLWVMERFWNHPAIVESAFHQYVDYFFSGLER